MTLTRKDAAATLVAALVVFIYAANVQGWWYLGNNRWAAVTMFATGAIGCPLGARIKNETPTASTIALGAVGVASLVLGIVAIVTGAQWALLALTLVLVALWLGTTLRHFVTPARRLAL